MAEPIAMSFGGRLVSVLVEGAHRRHLANTVERSVHGSALGGRVAILPVAKLFRPILLNNLVK